MSSKNNSKEKNKEQLINRILLIAAAVVAVPFLTLVLLILNQLANDQITSENQRSKLQNITLTTGNRTTAISVEVADTPEEWSSGLMNRTWLDPQSGMLFVFPDEQQRSFWMKNTYIPLDIVFFDREGRVVNIHQNTTPLDTSITYDSLYPARFALELNAGSIEGLGINRQTKLDIK